MHLPGVQVTWRTRRGPRGSSPGPRGRDCGWRDPALRAGCRPAEGTASTRAGLREIKLTQASGGQRKTGTNTLWWFKLRTSGRQSPCPPPEGSELTQRKLRAGSHCAQRRSTCCPDTAAKAYSSYIWCSPDTSEFIYLCIKKYIYLFILFFYKT